MLLVVIVLLTEIKLIQNWANLIYNLETIPLDRKNQRIIWNNPYDKNNLVMGQKLVSSRNIDIINIISDKNKDHIL